MTHHEPRERAILLHPVRLDRRESGATNKHMSVEPPSEPNEPTMSSFSLNEDWLATTVGLLLLAAALLGWIPQGVLW